MPKPKTHAKRPAYSYARWSTLEQTAGDSLRRQSDPLESICAEFGWALQSKTYKDAGVRSFDGTNWKTGDLSVFLASLRAGELEPNPVLILEDLDRLSRAKIMESVDVARKILEAGCDIYSVLEKKLYTREALNDPMGLMGLIWRFHLAHEESKKKSERELKRWQKNHQQAKDGVVFSKICPGWLRVVDRRKEGKQTVGGRFEAIPERVAVVKQIFKWCIEGQGTQQIMRRLVREGVPTFGEGKRAGGWSQKTLWQILRDRRVLGVLNTKGWGAVKKAGEIIEGYYPAIISEKTFTAAQDAMLSRKNKTGRRSDYVFLFSGLVKYPEHNCNMVMVSKQSNRKTKSGTKLHEYRYLTSYLGWKGEKPYVAVSLEIFERQILSWLNELKPSDVVRREEDGEGVDVLRARLTFLERRIKEVSDLLTKANANLPSVFQQLANMEVQKTELSAEIEERQRESGRPGIKETQSLLQLLGSKTGAELIELRQQARQRLLLLIDHIDVEVYQRETGQAVSVVVALRSGATHHITYVVYAGRVVQGTDTARTTDGKARYQFSELDLPKSKKAK